MLARAARQHVPVVLSGDGADELFGGYPTYKADRLAAMYRRLPLPVRALVGTVVRLLPTSTDKLSVEFRLRQFVRGVEDGDLSRSHFAWRRFFTAAERDALLLPDVRAAARSDTDDRLATLVRTAPAATDLQRAIYADLKTFLVDSILAKVDAMTMSHGLEARVPLLDHQVVELAARIPDRLKVGLKRGKKIFRAAVRGRVPAEVLARRLERRLPPLAAWLKSELRDTVSDVLSARHIGSLGLVDPGYVEQLKQEHFAGTANHAFKLWNLVHFVEWHRLFVRGEWTTGALKREPAAVATEARH
jgi:asparagine synthase (glutamine-hydrolysing)